MSEPGDAGAGVRRAAFLRDLTAAMLLADAPAELGERWDRTPREVADRCSAALWCDPVWVRHFVPADYPELPAAVLASVTALVKSFLRATTAGSEAGPEAQDRVLARSHLASLVERMRPVLEAHWAARAQR